MITDISWLKNDFIPLVQKRGAAVIKQRGASSAASAANAALMTVYNLVHETRQGELYSVARCSEGEYGIDKGLIFSFPCRTEGGKSKVITGFEQNEFGKERIQITLDELRQERDAVMSLGLITATA